MKNALLFLFFSMLSSCFSTSEAVMAQVDAAKVEEMLTDKTVQLVDLRTDNELEQTGKIAGARQVNFNSGDFTKQIAVLDKSRPVLLYCAAGSRSSAAAAQLKEMGFKKIYNYSGGMNDWKSKGKKTVPR